MADPRMILIHAQMAREDQIARMKALGVTPSFFSAHTWYWGDRHRDIFLGPERAAVISPARWAQDYGLRFSSHLDTPVTPMLPLQAVWSQVERITSGGDVLGPEQRIGVMEALRAVTIDAAWQVFQEGNRGSLEPGKYADLVVLSGNPAGPIPWDCATWQWSRPSSAAPPSTANPEEFIAVGVDTRRSFRYKYPNGLSENLAFAVFSCQGKRAVIYVSLYCR